MPVPCSVQSRPASIQALIKSQSICLLLKDETMRALLPLPRTTRYFWHIQRQILQVSMLACQHRIWRRAHSHIFVKLLPCNSEQGVEDPPIIPFFGRFNGHQLLLRRLLFQNQLPFSDHYRRNIFCRINLSSTDELRLGTLHALKFHDTRRLGGKFGASAVGSTISITCLVEAVRSGNTVSSSLRRVW
jgi:hypothetical protein